MAAGSDRQSLRQALKRETYAGRGLAHWTMTLCRRYAGRAGECRTAAASSFMTSASTRLRTPWAGWKATRSSTPSASWVSDCSFAANGLKRSNSTSGRFRRQAAVAEARYQSVELRNRWEDTVAAARFTCVAHAISQREIPLPFGACTQVCAKAVEENAAGSKTQPRKRSKVSQAIAHLNNLYQIILKTPAEGRVVEPFTSSDRLVSLPTGNVDGTAIPAFACSQVEDQWSASTGSGHSLSPA